MTWNTAFSQQPAGSSNLSDGDNAIRDFKTAVFERFTVEHKMNLSSGLATEDGWHRQGSAIDYYQTTAPTTRPDGVTALDVNDYGRRWTRSTDYAEFLYTSSGWVILHYLTTRGVLSTSGTLGALTVVNDYTYYLTAASTAMLPANGVATPGQRLTFKAKTNATSTISAAAGQTIGTTSSTSFILYAQEDYVTLEYDGSSIWYVVATNGPVLSSDQNAGGALTSGGWLALGNGLSLGTVAPGVYDLEIDASFVVGTSNNSLVGLGIGNVLSLISSASSMTNLTSTDYVAGGLHAKKFGYVLTSSAVLQGIYTSSSSVSLSYSAGVVFGKITARRIG